MVALALLAAGLAISAIDREPARSSWPRVFSAIVTAAIFANACVWFNGSIDVRPIEEQVARLGPRPKLLVLSAAVVIGYPMVRGAARHLGLAPGSLLGPGGGAPCRARRNDRRPGGSPPVRPCCTGARWADRRFPAAAARRCADRQPEQQLGRLGAGRSGIVGTAGALCSRADDRRHRDLAPRLWRGVAWRARSGIEAAVTTLHHGWPDHQIDGTGLLRHGQTR